MLQNLGKDNSLLNQFIAELRDVEIQKDSLRFRRNLERIGEIFAYEISKKLAYEKKEVITPLGTAEVEGIGVGVGQMEVVWKGARSVIGVRLRRRLWWK